MKLVVAILLISAVPGCAQAQTPSVPTVSKDEAQKVVAIIKSDKAKIKTYCDIKKLGRQMEQDYQKRDMKTTDELSRKIESLEKTLGTEYVALVDRLGAMDPENDKLADEITSLFEALDRRLYEVGLENLDQSQKSESTGCDTRDRWHILISARLNEILLRLRTLIRTAG